jgi:hypothetical protein
MPIRPASGSPAGGYQLRTSGQIDSTTVAPSHNTDRCSALAADLQRFSTANDSSLTSLSKPETSENDVTNFHELLPFLAIKASAMALVINHKA